MSDASILVVDDESAMCELVATALKKEGIAVDSAGSADAALQRLREADYDAVLTDIRMPGTSGLELCREIHERRPDLPVIVMTAFGNLDNAVSAMRNGAYDFITKPVELSLLRHTVSRAIERHQLAEKIRRLEQRPPVDTPDVIGESELMKDLKDQVTRIAASDASVLITGESGTGKEVIARSIHQASDRAQQPFVGINCGALSETLLESELFGHAQGAFTDARKTRRGLFLEADGGTLLLDEIGDMPISMQVKLLRAIEERRVRPLGSDQEVPFDVRLIAATHQDLEAAVQEGRFRQDLFYRINVIDVRVPPLRSRGTDVLLLADVMIRRFAEQAGKSVGGVTQTAIEKLLSYDWPGNVRELRNVIERAVALAQHDKITVEDLPEKIRDHKRSTVWIGGEDPEELQSLEAIEDRYIRHVLEAVGGNQTQAAKILGIDRKTLYRRLRE